ncbi:RICIN domain-containing protein [Sphaerisporangium viridialbum]|uniref:RICIN domain-containing protein n=1 Tax=Sphaerisporangium viridialbum TaxID=46189 RepID=UPI003C71AA50
MRSSAEPPAPRRPSRPSSGRSIFLRNPNSGRYLNVTGNNPADATPVTIWDCGTGPNQKWTLP